MSTVPVVKAFTPSAYIHDADKVLDLPAHAVHVWSFPEAEADQIAALRALLSTDERERADRFRFARHQNAFIANRGRLRILLAQYLGTRPQAIRFKYGPQGKPMLEASAEHDLHFNLSHTDRLAMVAVARGIHLGLDVEKIKDATDFLEIARHHFATGEYRDLAAIDTANGTMDQRHAFYRCWTRKEAILKGIGDGLQRPLDAFQVSFLRDQRPALLVCNWDPSLCEAWHLQPLDAGDSYVAALAYRPASSDVPTVHAFNFSY